MYHPDFELPSPPEPSAIIWRYMDLRKFKDLLSRQALFCCRADRFEDHWEGHYTRENARHQLRYAHVPLDENAAILRAAFGVNCWHIDENESGLFWQSYIRYGKGVAVQSTLQRLIESIDDNDDQHVVVNSVRYVDYDAFEIPLSPPVSPLFHKRREFESERELRLVVMKRYRDRRGMLQPLYAPLEEGEYVGVDLRALVHSVRLAPHSTAAVLDDVHESLQALGLEGVLATSTLDVVPAYDLWRAKRRTDDR